MSGSIQAIVMPKLGLSMTEGTVSQWHVSTGSKVSPGDVIADIETSKITNELEVHTEGVIRGDLAEEGVEFPVGTLLGVIADESVSEADIVSFVKNFVPPEGDEVEAIVSSDASVNPQITDSVTQSAVSDKETTEVFDIPDAFKGKGSNTKAYATHLAKKLADKYEIDLTKIEGTGRRGRISKDDIKTAIEGAGGSLTLKVNGAVSNKGEVKATHLARKLADETGIDLASITPTGSRGRINKKDVEKKLASRPHSVTQPTSTTVATSSETTPIRFPEPRGKCEDIPLTKMRKVIGKRLKESKQNAPHFRLHADVNVDNLLRMRNVINAQLSDGKISLNDLLIKVVAGALSQTPEMNIQFDGQTIRRFEEVDIAVAVALEEGLVTPVIRSAHQKRLEIISKEMNDLALRAKEGALQPDEIEGGTFTLSNLGMFGISAFDAIINPPQVAILAVGTAEKRYLPSEEGPEAVSIMTATLSCDHRVIDGATGARFMKTLRELIEQPIKLLV